MKKYLPYFLAWFAAGIAMASAQVAIHNYQNTKEETDAAQKSALIALDVLDQQEEALGASRTIETPIAFFETSLASQIDENATTMTLVSATTFDGTSLSSSTYAFVIDGDNGNREIVRADCTGTACTNLERGLSSLTATTSVTALKKTHRRGANVKISDISFIKISRIVDGIAPFPSPLMFDGKLTYTSQPTLSGALDVVYKDYADNIAAQGAATSSATVGGIIEIASATEAASTTTNLPNQPLALTTGISSSSPDQTTQGPLVIVSEWNRKLKQTWLNLAEPFTFTAHTILSTLRVTNATSTNATTTALDVTGLARFTGSATTSFTGPITASKITEVHSTSTTGALPTVLTNTVDVTAYCVLPKVVVGGGYSGLPGALDTAGNVAGHLVQTDIPSGNGWRVVVICTGRTGATCNSGTLTVYATCVNP